MAKVQIKSDKLTPFGVFFLIMEKFNVLLVTVSANRYHCSA